MHPPIPLKWHALDLFDERFRANVKALSSRDRELAARLAAHQPATSFFIAAQGDSVFLGKPGDNGISVVPDPLPPPEARRLLASLYPSGEVTWPLLIGGLAYGWAWDRISKMPCRVDGAPGHKPPVYFLTSDLDQLWAVLHVMEWEPMLADPRFKIIAGHDTVGQLKDLLVNDFRWSRPKAAIRIESALWTGEFNTLIQSINEAIDARTARLKQRLAEMYTRESADSRRRRIESGDRLRIMGITSRFTTFLQYSMRDWLAGFEQLGHQTQVLIEPADHLICGPPAIAQAVEEYHPDLIVIIDHYRAEVGLIPETVPCVMYVQDRLPNMYCQRAGQLQGPMDYALGFSRLSLTDKYGYPPDRFMSAPVGINENRFVRGELSPSEDDRFTCDVSYVSNASRSAAAVMREQALKSGSKDIERLFDDLYERMEGWYCEGGHVISEFALPDLLNASMATTGTQLDEKSASETLLFFHQEINNRIFRHQTLEWLADSGVNLHLWGKGWEAHPRFSRFAKGIADNHRDLPAIYGASKINIQVTPHGSVHQRLLDGLAAGGFFLLRWHPGDAVGRMYRELHSWCQSNGITNDAQLHAQAGQRVTDMIRRINLFEGSRPESRFLSVFDVMNGHADTGFTASADAIWPEYEAVSFANGGELDSKLIRFLTDESARQDIAASMRKAVIERFSYASINRRLLGLMRNAELSAERAKCAA